MGNKYKLAQHHCHYDIVTRRRAVGDDAGTRYL